jgi:hypothetical protein
VKESLQVLLIGTVPVDLDEDDGDGGHELETWQLKIT